VTREVAVGQFERFKDEAELNPAALGQHGQDAQVRSLMGGVVKCLGRVRGWVGHAFVRLVRR
jgi:hypothetical protein